MWLPEKLTEQRLVRKRGEGRESRVETREGRLDKQRLETRAETEMQTETQT